jgi:hypothetical protein
MARTTPFRIDDFIDGYLSQLRTEAEFFSDNIDQAFEKGRLNETHLSALLRRYLPRRFGIGTGFVGAAHAKSHQSDIIFHDPLQNAPLYESEAFAIYPIEMVYGVVEVKTNASSRRSNKKQDAPKTELEDCFEKCAHLRSMTQTDLLLSPEETEAIRTGNSPDPTIHFNEKRQKVVQSHKGYILHAPNGVRLQYYDPLPPRFFIFSYRGWESASDLYNDFVAATLKYPAAHIHGLCTLTPDGSFFTRHVPYAQSKDKVLPVAENGFREWLYSLPEMLHTMLPPHRNGMGFDMVNLQRYRVLSKAPEGERSHRVDF